VLQVRPYRPSDFDRVRPWIGDPGSSPWPPYAPRPSDGEVRRLLDGDDQPNLARFAMVVREGRAERVVGEVQYRHSMPVFPPGVFGLGVVVWNPADRGRGYGTEAQRQLVDRLFEHERGRRIQAETHPRNTAERRVLERLGFTAEGVLRDYFDAAEDLGDLVMYSLLRREWTERRERERGAGR
jgi:RimJ/RimL family protein N-acetyltransferase